MGSYNSRERLINTFEGREVDHIPTYDILHNIDLIEFLTGKKINPKNAEDLLCTAANKILDLIRHFAVPDLEAPRIFKDKQGFIYKYEWWTGHVIERPEFDSVEDVVRVIEKDIEEINECRDKKKICDIANQHVNLFYESCETFEEVRSEYRRISDKLDGTVMMGPETVSELGVAIERYDYKWFSYLYYDYPDITMQYLDALTEYQLSFIESFADFDLCPFAFDSQSVGSDDRLLFPIDWYKNIILPRREKKIGRWRSRGLYHISFLDGYKLPVLDDFINLGTDAIDPLEIYAGITIKEFREKYPEIVICQPIDCNQLLTYGRKEEVRDSVLKAIEDAGAYKILIGSTSEIHPGVNIKNVLTMYETAREYRL